MNTNLLLNNKLIDELKSKIQRDKIRQEDWDILAEHLLEYTETEVYKLINC